MSRVSIQKQPTLRIGGRERVTVAAPPKAKGKKATAKPTASKKKSEPKKSATTDEGTSLDDFNAKDARDIVAGEESLDQREAWRKSETRVTVERAIAARIAEFTED